MGWDGQRLLGYCQQEEKLTCAYSKIHVYMLVVTVIGCNITTWSQVLISVAVDKMELMAFFTQRISRPHTSLANSLPTNLPSRAGGMDVYSGTSLILTFLGQKKVSSLVRCCQKLSRLLRCPHFMESCLERFHCIVNVYVQYVGWTQW